MGEITTIGLDIAKNVFQLHGVDADGAVVLRKSLRRGQMQPFFEKLAPCLIGMEACATAHHWARTLMDAGHDVRLIPPSYIKPYLRRQKNDAADAAAICEARHATVDAVCSGQEPRSAGDIDATQRPRASDFATDWAHQCRA